VMWPRPKRAPITISVFTRTAVPDAAERTDLIRHVAHIALAQLQRA